MPEEKVFSTADLMKETIIPMTRTIKGPFLAFVPEEHRGPPSIFVSHAWSAHVYTPAYKFGTLQAVSPQGIAGIKEEFVWIDMVCYNQHSDFQIAPDMAQVIGKIGKIAFPITHTPLFDRIWCLWELLCAAESGVETQFCAAPGYRTDKRLMVNNFVNAFRSVERAQSTEPEDKRVILGEIDSHFGGLGAANLYITELMDKGLSHRWFEKYR
ncbi:MAG: hypothetical protein AAF636_27460 [Pseudomonadota bacterium]